MADCRGARSVTHVMYRHVRILYPIWNTGSSLLLPFCVRLGHAARALRYLWHTAYNSLIGKLIWTKQVELAKTFMSHSFNRPPV